MRKRLVLIFVMIVAGLVYIPVLSAAPGADIRLEPNLVAIGASYNGTRVSLSGEVPRDAEVLVRLSGATTDEVFLEKGRVLGVLWMNTDKVTFHHIPKTYLLYTPSGITAADLIENPQWRDLGIGFGALKEQAEITPAGEKLNEQFGEFLKLKTKEGLYGVHENAVTYGGDGKANKSFTGQLEIPSAVPPGTYTVTTFIIKDGKIRETIDQQLKIEETGLPAVISSLAFGHSVLYGILAILFAIGAGLLMGVFFRKGGEAH